jgi:hypothetical protein
MSLIYKILFEVKVLHEFYLTESNGETIFDLNNQADRLVFLSKKFAANQENINSEINFLVPEQAKKLYADHRLKLLTTYAGFKLGMEVKQVRLPDNSVTYEPKIPLADDINIPVLLVKKNDLLDGFTNKNIQKPLNAGYYFSNENLTGNKSFPFLAADTALFDPSMNYEQGELVKFPTNDYGELYKDDANVVKWVSFTGGGYSNDNDRLLLATNFYYSFPPAVTDAHVTIKDAAGNIIKDKEGNSISEFHFVSSQSLGKVRISIDPSRVLLVPHEMAHEKLLYTLEVNGNNGYSKTHKLFFMGGEFNAKACLALVNIKSKVTDPAFNVIDNAGKLLTRKLPDGTHDPMPPVFEIRLKSRLSFWRYINDKRKNIQSGLHPDFLISKNGTLVSKAPRALTYGPTLFRNAVDNTLHYLPNPERYALIKTENDKIYSDITVRESDLFPLAP